MKYIIQTIVTPSQIYKNESAATLDQFLMSRPNIKIVGFGPPKAGDLFIACDEDCFDEISLMGVSCFGEKECRFIVEEFKPAIDPSQIWE